MATSKAVLIVIDGWGVPGAHTRADGDAIAAAKTPVMDSFRDGETSSGYTEIEASSNAVGLPDGLMGNSEVGHLNIGAGRVVWQDVVRIDMAIKKDTFKKTENIVKSFERAKKGNGRLHLLGLVSDGGVHSHIEHLAALIKVAKEMEVPEVFVHFFGDGRDTDPKSGAGYMKDLLGRMKEIGCGEIATVVGRYYIMDRDKRWERVEVGLKAIVTGEGEESTDPVKTIEERYQKNETDEFLKPIIVGGKERRVQGERPHGKGFRDRPANELGRW
jgi:2,3-bisphosphoglycerate-independent phosphoglycerate mutase